jgi:hypothetical protein
MTILGGNMTQENHDHDWHEYDSKAERDPFSRELDTALAKYSAVEPRTGLEARVLANLQAQRDYVLTRSWWRWSFVSATAVLAAVAIIVASLAWRSGKTHAPLTAHHSTTIAPVVAQSGQRNAQDGSGRNNAGRNAAEENVPARNGSEKNDLARSFRPAGRPATHQSPQLAVANAHPKLDQFPSPQPLSEQEKILTSYIRNYPESAVLLARARTEALRKDQLEETRAFPSNEWDTDSEDTSGDKTQR